MCDRETMVFGMARVIHQAELQRGRTQEIQYTHRRANSMPARGGGCGRGNSDPGGTTGGMAKTRAQHAPANSALLPYPTLHSGAKGRTLGRGEAGDERGRRKTRGGNGGRADDQRQQTSEGNYQHEDRPPPRGVRRRRLCNHLRGYSRHRPPPSERQQELERGSVAFRGTPGMDNHRPSLSRKT